jgi:alpha-tubulin suppressor-like RCC1 family protein
MVTHPLPNRLRRLLPSSGVVSAGCVAALALGAAVASAALVSACHEPFDPGQVLVAVVVSGNTQQDTVGQALPEPLVVQVKDAQGRVVYGVTVEFAVTFGGGSVSPSSSVIGSSSFASTRWTLGTSTAAAQVVVARVVDPRSGAVADSTTFHATARPGPAVTLAKVAGDSQTGDIGATLAQLLTVQSRDQYGNSVPGTPVSWSLSSPGLGGGLSPALGSTDASGFSHAQWTLGPRLSTTFGARAAAPALGAISFTAVSGSNLTATALVEILGNAQTVMSGTIAPESVGVQVSVRLPTDTSRSYVVGLPVTFGVTSGGGSITPAAVNTNSQGVARAVWTLGAAMGQHVATATLGGRSVTLSALGVAPTLTAVGDSQVAYVGTTPIESVGVRVTSLGCCNGVAGVTVTFAVTGGGGSITPAQALTDANGTARVQWTLGSAPGINTATATVGTQSVTLTVRGIQPVAVAAIAAGGQHSCAITASGGTYCWGANAQGQLGDGTTTDRRTGVAVLGVALASLAAGSEHTCGLDAAGTAYCWGRNVAGQLGDGTTTSRSVPAAVAGAPPFRSLAAGGEHTCGLTAAGAAYCWGDNSVGQLGDSTRTARTQPVVVVGGLAFSKLVTGYLHTCALTAAGAVYCWGENDMGQLGVASSQVCNSPSSGSVACSLTPVRVATTLVFADLAGGVRHACALTGAGAAFCWGEGSQSLEPLPSQPAFARLASGFSGGWNCAATAAGQEYCWEFYWYDYYGSYRWISPAYAVAGALSFDGLAIGSSNHMCSTATGTRYAYCWGSNDRGQLGDGSTTWRGAPTPVLLPTP